VKIIFILCHSALTATEDEVGKNTLRASDKKRQSRRGVGTGPGIRIQISDVDNPQVANLGQTTPKRYDNETKNEGIENKTRIPNNVRSTVMYNI
jgi:hypothetical protein